MSERFALASIKKEWPTGKLRNGTEIYKWTVTDGAGKARFVEAWGQEEKALVVTSVGSGRVLEWSEEQGKYGARYRPVLPKQSGAAHGAAPARPADQSRDRIILWQNALNVSVAYLQAVQPHERSISNLIANAYRIYAEGLKVLSGKVDPDEVFRDAHAHEEQDKGETIPF